MTVGIRQFAVAKFNELLDKRSEIGNTKFRKTVMDSTIEAFGISIASAATHYNHALKMAKANTPHLVEGLGRPDDKKGGRKPTHLFNVVIDAEVNTLVAGDLSRAKAQELIDAAKAAGKVALKMVEVVVATADTPVQVDEVPQTAPIDDGEAAADAAEEAGALNLQDEPDLVDVTTVEEAPF